MCTSGHSTWRDSISPAPPLLPPHCLPRPPQHRKRCRQNPLPSAWARRLPGRRFAIACRCRRQVIRPRSRSQGATRNALAQLPSEAKRQEAGTRPPRSSTSASKASKSSRSPLLSLLPSTRLHRRPGGQGPHQPCILRPVSGPWAAPQRAGRAAPTFCPTLSPPRRIPESEYTLPPQARHPSAPARAPPFPRGVCR